MRRNSRSVSPKPPVYSSAPASELGKNTFVGVCSMIVRLIRTIEHVAGALRRQAHHTVQLPPGFRTVLGEAFEGRIGEQAPELVHPTDESTAVEKLADQVKQIKSHRRARDVVPQELRNVEADHGMPRKRVHNTILGVVEHPRVVAFRDCTPASQTREHSLGVRGVEKLDESR